jgi:hypothetical protein
MKQSDKQIFVGGTGRSGTTILNQLLGLHSEIHAIPGESRFLIDPYGLMNLSDALSHNFSTTQSRYAVKQFQRLMLKSLAQRKYPPYLGLGLDEILGKENYWKQTTEFVDKLKLSTFHGADYQTESSNLLHHLSFPLLLKLERFGIILKRRLSNSTKRFAVWPREEYLIVDLIERSDLMKLMSQYVDSLFSFEMQRAGKQIWSEKTPHNFLHIDFIRKLFPESYFIHIYRDPRAIVSSLKTRIWAPSSIDEICDYLSVIFKRWFEIKSTSKEIQKNYHELSLESLISNSDSELGEIWSFLGVDANQYQKETLQSAKIDDWKKYLSDREIDKINTRLGEYIEMLGYKI